jgi:hypothetical protein
LSILPCVSKYIFNLKKCKSQHADFLYQSGITLEHPQLYQGHE